jgi:small-conductance mechanosensitive channel
MMAGLTPVGFSRPQQSLEVFGIRLVGITAESGRKLLLTLAVLAVLYLLGKLMERLTRAGFSSEEHAHTRFWWRQTVRLVTAGLGTILLVSIWFDDPQRLTTVLGLVSAGVAIALQRLITAFAAYFVILRGRVFRVGDRIVMGGVRGDVIDLGFIRTSIMEMGQPPPVQKDEPAIWVEARQYSGRIVTVTNDKIFDEPIYNYTRDFPFIWEELHLPIPYQADRGRAEEILLAAAQRHTLELSELSEEALQEFRRRYFVESPDLKPRVYWQLTDNWLELAVRFVTRDRGVRELKDAMSREILNELQSSGISIASATFELVGLPPVRVVNSPPNHSTRTPPPG